MGQQNFGVSGVLVIPEFQDSIHVLISLLD